jgi:hypothetical protein
VSIWQRPPAATGIDGVTQSSGPALHQGVLVHHILLCRAYAGPLDLAADLPAYAASLRGKASALGLHLAGEVSCDIVRNRRRLPGPQRRALARDGACISRQDRRRWVIVRVWAAVLAGRHAGRDAACT